MTQLCKNTLFLEVAFSDGQIGDYIYMGNYVFTVINKTIIIIHDIYQDKFIAIFKVLCFDSVP